MTTLLIWTAACRCNGLRHRRGRARAPSLPTLVPTQIGTTRTSGTVVRPLALSLRTSFERAITSVCPIARIQTRSGPTIATVNLCALQALARAMRWSTKAARSHLAQARSTCPTRPKLSALFQQVSIRNASLSSQYKRSF